MRGVHPPTSHFENVYDVGYRPTIFLKFGTSSIAISLTPSASRLHQKLAYKRHYTWRSKHSELGSKNFNQFSM